MTQLNTPLLVPTRDAIARMLPFPGLGLEHIHLVSTPQDAKEALAALRESAFVGFDTESRPTFRKGQKSQGPHVLQFATMERAYIFQTLHEECTPVVTELLRSKKVVKIGFGLNDDILRIGTKFCIQPRSIIDLDYTFKINFDHKNSIGVKNAVALLFNRRFTKSHKATTSNWAHRLLSEKQLRYAANDAYAAIAVHTELKKRGIEVAHHRRPLSPKKERTT